MKSSPATTRRRLRGHSAYGGLRALLGVVGWTSLALGAACVALEAVDFKWLPALIWAGAASAIFFICALLRLPLDCADALLERNAAQEQPRAKEDAP